MDPDGAWRHLNGGGGHVSAVVSCAWVLLLLRFVELGIATIELLDTTGRIDNLLLACEERVALRTKLNLQRLTRRTRFEDCAATACYFTLVIAWMQVLFHCITS